MGHPPSVYTFRDSLMYTSAMQVTITEFRRNLFNLVEQAMNGVEVHVTHKGKGFSLKPDDPPPDRLSRITPLDIIVGDLEDRPDKAAMRRAWERDWDDL